jgi:cytochrome c553
LQKALADYRSGRRTNLVMAGFAAPLSDQDIEDLAAWYASQDGLKDLSIK